MARTDVKISEMLNMQEYHTFTGEKARRATQNIIPDQPRIRIAEILDAYLKFASLDKRLKTVKRDKCSRVIWDKFFKEIRIVFVDQITRKQMMAFVNWRLENKTKQNPPSKRSINIDLGMLRRALGWAVNREMIAKNPIVNLDDILLRQKSPALPVIFRLDELKELEALSMQTSPGLYKIIAVLARTGLRSGELCELTIDNIDLERKQIRLSPEQTKANYWRVIPLMGKVFEILAQAVEQTKQENRKFVFPNEHGQKNTSIYIWTRFRRLLNHAEKLGKIKDTKRFHPHCLRATFISHLVMAGEDPAKIMAIVGHRDWVTMRKYLCFLPEYLADVKALPY